MNESTPPSMKNVFGMKYVQRVRVYKPVAFDLTLIGLRRSAFNPTIDQLPGRAVLLFSDNSMSLARFLFRTISHVSM